METPFDEFSGDIIFRCHAEIAAKMYSELGPQSGYWKGSSFSSSAYRYEVSIQPALHGQDLYYYFYNEAIAAGLPTLNAEVARKFQHYLRRFILGQDLEDWLEYSSTGLNNPSWMNVTSEGFQPVTGEDETDRATRCEHIVRLLSNPDDGW